MRKIRLVKTNQSPTGLAAVLEAGGTWGQVSLHFLSVFLIIWVSEQYWFIIPVTLLASLLALSSNPIQSNHLRCFLLLLLQSVAQSFLSDCTEVNQESRMFKYIRCSTYKITTSHKFPSMLRSQDLHSALQVQRAISPRVYSYPHGQCRSVGVSWIPDHI